LPLPLLDIVVVVVVGVFGVNGGCGVAMGRFGSRIVV